MGWLTWEPNKYRLYASLGFLLFAWTTSIVMYDQHDVRPSNHHSETAHIWAYARDGAHVLRPLLMKLHIPVEDLASFFVLSPVLYGLKPVAPTELNCIAVITREPDTGPDLRYKSLVVWDDLYAVWNRTAGPWLLLEREPLHGLLGAFLATTVTREIARAGITEHHVRCWLMTAAGYEALLAQSVLPVVETAFLPVANRWVDRHTYPPFNVDVMRVQRAVVEVSERRWEAAKSEIQRNGRTMDDGAFIRLKRELIEALRMFSFARQLVTMERIANFTDAARFLRPVGSVKQAEWVHFESLDRDFETERSLLRRFEQRD